MSYFKYENGIITTIDVRFDYDIEGGVGVVLFKKMKEHLGKTAQVDARTGKSDTFQTLLQKSIRTATVLRKRGVKKGDLIALCSDHHLNAPVPLVAAFFVGAIPFALCPTQTVEEHTHLLKQIHPKVVFVIKNALSKIEQSFRHVGLTSTEIVIFGENFETEFLSKQNDEDEQNFQPEHISNLEETAAIYFSSGSTGLPKGICLKHYAFMNFCYPGMKQAEGENPVVFSNANWYWASSGIHLFTFTVIGGCRLLASEYKTEELWKWIDKYRITKLSFLLFDCINLTNTPKPESLDCKSLRGIVTAGAPIPQEYIKKMEEILPGIRIMQVYGMTELLSVTVTMNSMDKGGSEGIGYPVPGVTYKVVDPDTEEIIGPNNPGELRLKSKRVMNGYYDRDSSEVFDDDGWFKTGDLVYFDEKCRFFFVSRLKEGISYRSQWVYPAQIENILVQHPSVKMAVVIGKPHDIDEEHPTAVVMLKEGYHDVKPEDLKVFVNDKVEDRNKLRGGVIFVKDFPLTNNGKVSRMKLSKQLFSKMEK